MALEGTILRCKAMQLYSAIMPYICILMQPNKCIYGRKKCYSLIPRFPKLGIFAAAGQVSTVSRFLCCGQSNPLRHSGREVPFGFICLTIRCANFEPQNGPRKSATTGRIKLLNIEYTTLKLGGSRGEVIGEELWYTRPSNTKCFRVRQNWGTLNYSPTKHVLGGRGGSYRGSCGCLLRCFMF
jgi:hypothetical protein